MKIVEVSFWFYEYTFQLANALGKRNEVHLFIPLEAKKIARKFLKNFSFTVHYFKKWRIRDIFKNINMIIRLKREIEKISPDIIHLQFDGTPWLTLLLFFLPSPKILTIHDITPHIGERALWKYITYRLAIRLSNGFIVHGNTLKSQLSKKYRIPTKKIIAIPHGNFLILRTKKKIKDPKTPTILFFGRIGKYKGLEYLIEAEPYISKKISNYRIVIAGRIIGGFSIKNYIKKIKKQKRYKIMIDKFIPSEKLQQLFESASVAVLPYIEASQSGVIPMAYTFEKPVIATKVGAIPEIVEDGKTGFLVQPKNARKLAEKIVYFFNLSKDKIKKMKKNIKMKVEKMLNWNRIGIAHEKFFKNFIIKREKT